MQKKVKKEIEVVLSFCNICKKEVTQEPFKKERIALVRGLFKIGDFDAHESCINKVVRQSFKKYV